MEQYFTLKSDVEPIICRLEGTWSILIDGTDKEGEATLLLNLPGNKKRLALKYAFEGDEDGKRNKRSNR